MSDRESPREFLARIAPGVATIDAAQWNACAGADDPFLSHAFLSALEESGSVGPGTGWQPAPILIEDDNGALLACAPAYFKSHSQGEYVFDHGWADAWHRAGGKYYPKLQIAVPFSPVPGKRLLVPDDAPPDNAHALIAAAEQIVQQNGISSAHATFVAPDQIPLFEAAGWLIREDNQFHWENDGYADFDDFLARLSSSKRKTLRKERAKAQEDLEIVQLTGDAIRPDHWDAFWQFYQDTGARKWGHPYLTRSFFDLIGERMAERIVLILALRDGAPIAGALNMIGADTLYGRYWGCLEDHAFLHFELCYHRAIDWAIAHGMARVEAGAQGEHKLARGYLPAEVHSLHWFADARFREAVADYLRAEAEAIGEDMHLLEGYGPFRRGPKPEEERE